MTRGCIKKRVVPLSVCEDETHCCCSLKEITVMNNKRNIGKHSYHSHQTSIAQKILIISIIILLALSSCVKCMRHMSMEEEKSTPGHNSIAKNIQISSLEDNNNNKSDDDDDEDDDFDYSSNNSDESGDATYSNDKVLEYYQQQKANYSQSQLNENTEMSLTPHTSTTTAAPKSGCQGSCLDRPSLESAALDSIKKHLLMKLGMEKFPNVTKTQKLPDLMLEALCTKNNMPVEYCTGKTMSKVNVEYQSDEPANMPAIDSSDVIEEEEDVQYMSVENRIYAYPSSE